MWSIFVDYACVLEKNVFILLVGYVCWINIVYFVVQIFYCHTFFFYLFDLSASERDVLMYPMVIV